MRKGWKQLASMLIFFCTSQTPFLPSINLIGIKKRAFAPIKKASWIKEQIGRGGGNGISCASGGNFNCSHKYSRPRPGVESLNSMLNIRLCFSWCPCLHINGVWYETLWWLVSTHLLHSTPSYSFIKSHACTMPKPKMWLRKGEAFMNFSLHTHTQSWNKSWSVAFTSPVVIWRGRCRGERQQSRGWKIKAEN